MPTHKKTESERFKGPAKYAEYLFARALITVLQRLPIALAYRLGRVVGWLAWKCLKRRRATVRKNLEIVNKWRGEQGAGSREQGAESGEQGTQSASSFTPHPSSLLEPQVRAVFLRAGANLFSGFTFNRMSPEQAARHIEIEGLEHLKAALAEGKGAIILLAHMGPWEALTQLPGLAKQQYGIEAPFGAIYRALNNHYLDEWYRQQREAQGTRMFLSRYKFYAPVDFLRSGGMLGVIADQRASGGENVVFFGKETRGTPLPGLLAKRAGCPMFAVAIETVSPMRWVVRVRAVDLPQGQRWNRSLWSKAVALEMEWSLSSSIEDGFWFHRRFR